MSGILHARVRNGRLEVEGEVDLPEGTEVDLVAVVANDAATDEERAQRDDAIDRGLADLRAGRVHAHEDVAATLRAMRKP